MFHRSTRAYGAARRLLDLVYLLALLPFRRARTRGRPLEILPRRSSSVITSCGTRAPGADNAAAGTPGGADPGEYLLVIDLVVEGLAWLSDRGSAPARVRLTVERGHERKRGGKGAQVATS